MLVIQERSNTNIPTVNYTRGLDLSGSLGGAGGIGGLLTRSSGYNSSTGAWSTHDYYHADGSGNITMLISNSTTPTIRAQYEYDPFGRIQPNPGPSRPPTLSASVPVKNCEVVILYGHGSSTNPHTFRFEGNCSAGHLVGCASSSTNDGIDRKYRIPGAPSTDDDLIDGPQAGFDPENAYSKHLTGAWEAAIKRAKAICAGKENCCKSVKVISKLAGNPFHPDNWKQEGGKSQKILCDGK